MRYRAVLALLVALAAFAVAPIRPAAAATLAFDIDSVPDGASGYFYSHVVGHSSGGTPPYSYTAIGLPAGVTVNPSGPIGADARLVGTPEAAGDYPFDLTVSDSAGDSVTTNATIHISPGQVLLRTNFASLGGTICQSLSPPPWFVAEGGALPYTWTLSELPRGVFFRDHKAGTDYEDVVRLVGAPKVAGTFPVVLTVESSEGTTDTLTMDLTIATGPVNAHDDQDGDGVAGLIIRTREGQSRKRPTLKAFCGDGTTFAWRALDPLPRGLRLSAAGELLGAPKDPGSTTFTAEVTSADFVDTMEVTVEVLRARLQFVTGERLERARVGRSYRTRIYADGGFPGYRWRLAGGSLPPGISLGERGDNWLRLEGTAKRAGMWEFKLKLTDSEDSVRRNRFFVRVVR